MLGLFRKKEEEVVDEAVVIEEEVFDEAVVIEEEVFDEAAVIDKETGITYCGGMEELYDEVVEEYCDQGADYIEQIRKFVSEQDWKNYQIVVHGIKSSSLTVGAVALSEKAKALEMAAKSDQIDYILAENDSFLSSYQKVLKVLKQ